MSLGVNVSFWRTGKKAFRFQVKLNLSVFKLFRKKQHEQFNRFTRVAI